MRRVQVNGPNDADGLLHRGTAVRQRRVHRRLVVLRQQSSTAPNSSSWSATVGSNGWTQWGVEPGVRRNGERTRHQLRQSPVRTRTPRSSTTGLTAERPYLGVDAKGRWVVRVPDARTGATGTDWADGHVDRALPLSSFFIATPAHLDHCDQHRIGAGAQSAAHPGPVQPARADPGQPAEHRGVRSRLSHPHPADRAVGAVRAAAVRRPHCRSVDRRRPAGVAGPWWTWVSPGTRPAGTAARRPCCPMCSSGSVDRASVRPRSRCRSTPPTWCSTTSGPGGPTMAQGVGWDQNTADTGVVVRGDRVSAYGLFVEHYQKTEVVWSGRDGSVVMFQNEMPYDPPNQAAWQEGPTKPGYPAFEVTSSGKGFDGWGMGSYSFFNQDVDIHAATAFRVPTKGVVAAQPAHRVPQRVRRHRQCGQWPRRSSRRSSGNSGPGDQLPTTGAAGRLSADPGSPRLRVARPPPTPSTPHKLIMGNTYGGSRRVERHADNRRTGSP